MKGVEQSECGRHWSRLLCAGPIILEDCGPFGVLTFKRDSDKLGCVQMVVTWMERVPGGHLKALSVFLHKDNKNEEDGIVSFQISGGLT